jgi:hypothetical protein
MPTFFFHFFRRAGGWPRPTRAIFGARTRGWKGGLGTGALAIRPRDSALARENGVRPAPGRFGACRRAELSERPIAVSLALICGGTAYLLKTGYDERFRAFAPGLILEDEIVRAFHASGFAERLDSASDAGGVLESLYPDRMRSGEFVFSTDPNLSAAALGSIMARERRIEALRRRLKRVYWRAVDARAAWSGRRAPA